MEQEKVIYPIIRRRQKFYPLDQVDRVRVARLLIEEMGVNLEGAEVALHMREQMIAMQRQFNELLRLLISVSYRPFFRFYFSQFKV